MTIKRDHVWMLAALVVGFVIGIYYSKNTSGSIMLATPTTTNPLGVMGSNGTASIPIYGMVTAAQGMEGQNS